MKKILVYLSLCLCGGGALQAQTLPGLFVSMPDSLSLVMTPVNRADCVDFIHSKMKAQVTNRFNTVSVVNQLTDDYLQAQVTSLSTWEMRRLPLKDSVNVVCWITTVSGPVKDSRIRFYDAAWHELDAARFLPDSPVADDFYLEPGPASNDSLQELRLKADIPFVQACLSADDMTLRFIYTTPDYLNKEDREKLEPYLRRSPIVYEWRGGKFIRRDDGQ